MRRISIIPQRDNMEESLRLSKEYNANFEYNDFFLPFVLDDEEKKKEIIDFYKNDRGAEFLPHIRTEKQKYSWEELNRATRALVRS